MAETRLLLQKEVAERLRCSEVKVKRLRMSGQLAYIPGRPLMVREADLEAYIEGAAIKKQRREKPVEPRQKSKAELEAEARAWAAQAVLLQRRSPK